MPKYLVQARYTTEGIQGLFRDSASGRRADVQAAVKTLGGKVEAFYYAFGDDDVVIILDLPNNIKAAAVSLTVSGSGTVRVRTTPLLTVEDVDQALEIKSGTVPPEENSCAQQPHKERSAAMHNHAKDMSGRWAMCSTGCALRAGIVLRPRSPCRGALLPGRV